MTTRPRDFAEEKVLATVVVKWAKEDGDEFKVEDDRWLGRVISAVWRRRKL